MEETTAVPTIGQIAEEAKRALPAIELRIRSILAKAHPLEILANLSLQLMHPGNEHPDTEEHARWQVRIEFVAWLLLSSPLVEPDERVFVDNSILQPLEEALDEYFDQYSLSLMPEPTGEPKTDSENRLLFQIRTEALHVRGEGLPFQVKELSLGMYGPHSAWFRANLGFTIEEAFEYAEIVFAVVGERFESRRKFARKEEERALKRYRALFKKRPKDMSESDVAAKKNVARMGPERSAQQYKAHILVARLRDTLSFSPEDVAASIGQESLPESFQKFLDRMSQPLGTATEKPDPIGFNPIAKHPLIRAGGRYMMPVPPALYEALLSSFHFDLWNDEQYRNAYDHARSDWLEQMALDSFRGLLPGATIGWSLKYGPKKNRIELDGMVVWDNRLILIEAKWKSLTVAARQGSADAAHLDIKNSIQAAYAQAARARDYIRSQTARVTFTAKDGSTIDVDPSEISEIYLVSLLGRGAMAVLASNLPKLVPLGFFAANEYPWALSLTDLNVVCGMMQSPSQLFDYIKRRSEVVTDARFLAHDEWDLLGLYLSGQLDVNSEQFAGAQGVFIAGADQGIDRYFRSAESPILPSAERPRRRLPENIQSVLSEIEATDQHGKTDFAVALLGFPDEVLEALGGQMEEMRKLSLADGKVHTASLKVPNRPLGTGIVSTSGDPELMRKTLVGFCKAKKYSERCDLWLGLGFDVLTGESGSAIVYLNEPWKEDSEFEKLIPSSLSGKASPEKPPERSSSIGG